MLGVTTVHETDLAAVELQSANDMKLPLRMAEYALRTYRLYEVFPRQYVSWRFSPIIATAARKSARMHFAPP